jgi:putative endonuclease
MEEEKAPAVYIMANRYRGAMYVGVTSALYYRVCDHKNERFDGYTKERGLKTLVWYEHHLTMDIAIRREKLLKKWHRDWKFRLIEGMNPDWLDLHDSIDSLATLVEEQAPAPAFAGVTVTGEKEVS